MGRTEGFMRRSKADKAVTHSKILAVAAKRFREKGLNGIGVAEVMKEAGSSAGGFYKHFNSRDDLVVEALAESFKFLDRIAAKAEDLPTYLDMVLSDEHHDNPGNGCGLTALSGDVRNAVPAVRTVYTQRVQQTLAYYADRIKGGTSEDRQARATLLFSACMGGVAIARATNDRSLSQQILKALRREVQALAKDPLAEKPIKKRAKSKK
jgi:TetR/AcrR family transcriptional repressor of nem operon